MRGKNQYPYGFVGALATMVNMSPEYISKVLSKAVVPSMETAIKIDKTKMVRGRSFQKEVIAHLKQTVF